MIERWECSTGCEWDGSETPPSGPHRYFGEWCHETPKLVQYVPASQLAGLVEENERLRAFIASRPGVRFEARCRNLISVEEYVASLRATARGS